MSKRALNTFMSIVGASLGAVGIICILLSVLAEKNTLIWGLLCVVLGTLCNIIRMPRMKE